MAKKKTEQKVIAVKRPKIGEIYEFWFAGGKSIGKLVDTQDKLADHYGEPWFKFFVPKGKDTNRDMWYPVSIYAIVRKVENIKIEVPEK